MLRRPIALLVLAIPALMVQPGRAGEPLAPASQWLPAGTPIVVELTRPDAFLDLVLDPEVTEALTSLPAFERQAATPGFRQFLGLIDYLEFRLGSDWQPALRKLIGGGATFAVGPKESALLVVDAQDAKMLNELHEILRGFAEEEARKEGNPDRVASADYRGVTGWTFGPNEAHAIIGNRLVMSNKPDALKAVIDMREDAEGQRLADLPAYQAAKKAAGPEAVAVTYVNLDVVKHLPGVDQALNDQRNPLAALLLAGMTEAVRESSWLALGLHVEGHTLKLEAAVDGKVADAAGPAAFAMPAEPGQGPLPQLSVPRRIASMSFYRDLHGFYAAKDDLFPERTSGLIFFENMMGIFFSGRDFTDEVLGETEPEVRVVVAEQEYDPKVGTPGVKIPAVALILKMRDPEDFSKVMEEAWQAALGLVNFTRGQQALPKMTIDRPVHGDTKYSTAYFANLPEDDKENLDMRFNFRPSLAMLDDYLILSSAEGITRDLIDAAKEEIAATVEPMAAVHSAVEIDGRQLASILGANRDRLVRQNMVEEGHTREEAEASIDVLLSAVEYVKKLSLEVGTRDGNTQASLELELATAGE